MDPAHIASTWLRWLMEVTVQVPLLIAAVLMVQRLCARWISPRGLYLLWLVVVTRLVLPGQWESSLHLFNHLPAETRAFQTWTKVEERSVGWLPVAETAPSYIPAVAAQTSFSPGEGAGTLPLADAPPLSEVTFSPGKEGRWVMVLFLGWLAGAILLFLGTLRQSLKTDARLRRDWRRASSGLTALLEECRASLRIGRSIQLVETSAIQSPAVYGWWNPRLLFPIGFGEGLSRRQLRLLFLHELAHVKRHDVAANWILTLLQCVHWFNPFVWLAFARMRADRELVCDSIALSQDQEAAREYCTTLIKVLENLPSPSPLPGIVGILEDKQSIKRRLTAILKQAHLPPRWLLCSVLLVGLGAGCLTRPLPHTDRPVQTEPAPIDLSTFYDRETSDFDRPGGVWSAVPRGEQEMGRVPFDIQGIIQLSGTEAERYGRRHRKAVEGIPAPYQFEQLYLLHGTAWSAPDGKPIAQVVFNYEDGSHAIRQIMYGRHVRNWWRPPHEIETVSLAKESMVAWTGEHPDARRWGGNTLRLYLTALSNPHPGKGVASIDLVSLEAEAAPVILALTAGPASLMSALALVEEMGELSPERLDQQIRIRLLHGETGRPVEGATLTVDLRQGNEFTFLGNFQSNRRGQARIRYPGLDGRRLSIRIMKRGFVPKTFEWNPAAGLPVPGQYTMTLDEGVSVGGVLVGQEGRPVPGARVQLEHPSEWQHAGHEWVEWGHGLFATTTDDQGRWRLDGVSRQPGEFHIRFSHGDRVIRYRVGDRSSEHPPELSRLNLLDHSAIAVLTDEKVQFPPPALFPDALLPPPESQIEMPRAF